MTNPITGLIHVTGEPDTGKTTFAITSGFPPEQICFFDDDLKTQAIADALAEAGTPFGAYYNLTKLSLGMREVQYHDLVMNLIDKLPRGKFGVLVFDTWTRFENTCFPKVQKNPSLFREFFSPMGAIKGAEMWKASFDYEALILDKLLQVAPLVILVTHLKDQNIGSVKTGREVPDCKKPVVEKSRLRIWLRHNAAGPAPVGLVLKRLSKIELSPAGLSVTNILPRKINPCTWERIFEYWQSPLGNRIPEESESPNAFELSILDGVLTEDQKDVLHINRVEADRPMASQGPLEMPVVEMSAPVVASAPPPTAPLITLDLLTSAFGVDEILAANHGLLPGTQAELMTIAAKLGVA